MLKKLIFAIAILFFVFQIQILAQRSSVRAKVVISAGQVDFVQTGNNDGGMGEAEWHIKLKGKVLGKLSEPYDAIKIVKIFKDFKVGEDVVIFAGEMMGSACASTYNILALHSSGDAYLSEPISNCAAPKVAQTAGKISLYFPRSFVTRGTGFVPPETWIYQNGELSRQKAVRRRR
jgi:hypothetical protein